MKKILLILPLIALFGVGCVSKQKDDPSAVTLEGRPLIQCGELEKECDQLRDLNEQENDMDVKMIFTAKLQTLRDVLISIREKNK